MFEGQSLLASCTKFCWRQNTYVVHTTYLYVKDHIWKKVSQQRLYSLVKTDQARLIGIAAGVRYK